MSKFSRLHPVTLKHLVQYGISLLRNSLLLNKEFTHFHGRNAWFLIRNTPKSEKISVAALAEKYCSSAVPITQISRDHFFKGGLVL